MNTWERLFYGGVAARERILADQTLEQVTRRLPGQSHSIYAELRHTVLWQNLLHSQNDPQYDRRYEASERYPEHPCRSATQWSALVSEFKVVEPGLTVAGVLGGLARPQHLPLGQGRGAAAGHGAVAHVRMAWCSGAKTPFGRRGQWTSAPVLFKVSR